MRPHAISPILSVLFFACAAIPLQAQKQCGHSAAVSVNNGAYKIGSNAFESDARECISIDNAGFTVTDSDIPWKNRPSAYPFIYIGIAFLIHSAWAVVLLPLVVLGIDRLVIAKEERYLRGKFGETYTSYCSRVRRWI